jgi:hypothetical protein
VELKPLNMDHGNPPVGTSKLMKVRDDELEKSSVSDGDTA